MISRVDNSPKISCPYCGYGIYPEYDHCPHCGIQIVSIDLGKTAVVILKDHTVEIPLKGESFTTTRTSVCYTPHISTRLTSSSYDASVNVCLDFNAENLKVAAFEADTPDRTP